MQPFVSTCVWHTFSILNMACSKRPSILSVSAYTNKRARCELRFVRKPSPEKTTDGYSFFSKVADCMPCVLNLESNILMGFQVSPETTKTFKFFALVKARFASVSLGKRVVLHRHCLSPHDSSYIFHPHESVLISLCLISPAPFHSVLYFPPTTISPSLRHTLTQLFLPNSLL